VLERLGMLDPDDPFLIAAVKDKELIVRAHALRILAERVKLTDREIMSIRDALLGGNDGLVQRVAAEALGRHPGNESLKTLLDLREQAATAADSFLLHTVRIALRDNMRAGTAWLVRTNEDIGALADVALAVPDPVTAWNIACQFSQLHGRQHGRMPSYVYHVARYGDFDKVRGSLVDYFFKAAAEDRAFGVQLLEAILRAAQDRGVAPDPAVADWGQTVVLGLLESGKPEDIKGGIDLAAALRHPPLRANVIRILIDRQKPEGIRLTALNGLAAFDPKMSVGTLALRLIDASESVTFRDKVAQWLASINVAEARAALLNALPTAPARLASTIAAGLASSADGATALLDAVAAGKASPRLLHERPVQVKLDALKRPEIAERVKKLTAGLPPADAAIAALLRKRSAAYGKAKPDVAAGRKVFEKSCATCHQIAGQGAKIGPQLDGIGIRGLDRLLEDVLDPNRNVDQSFRATTLTLKNGQSLSGLVLREEGAVIVLADAQGKEQRVSKEQIAEREISPLSPMPANWADQIAEKDFHDMMAYLLEQKGK
jgi:putative heme-binding domain-containing protein